MYQNNNDIKRSVYKKKKKKKNEIGVWIRIMDTNHFFVDQIYISSTDGEMGPTSRFFKRSLLPTYAMLFRHAPECARRHHESFLAHAIISPHCVK